MRHNPQRPEVQAFVDFVLSPAGQTIVGRRLGTGTLDHPLHTF